MSIQDDWLAKLASIHALTAIVMIIIAYSIYRGYRRGAYSSTRTLVQFLLEGAVTITALFICWKLGSWLSVVLRDWLVSSDIVIPNEQMSTLKQLYYTFLTGLRDFSLLRFGFILLILFPLIKFSLSAVMALLLPRTQQSDAVNMNITKWSSLVGSLIGLAFGAVRSFFLLVLLLVYVLLFPQAPFTEYIQASQVYQNGVVQWLQPYAEPLLKDKLPVFTRAVEEEFQNILQRRYEIIDQHIPDDIAAAAHTITANMETDEAKARALYDWVGSRVRYDWEKVRRYEEQNDWMEQTPQDTFASRKGVCIDYARLYAVMARAVDLQVKVVTGLGYDGRGGYGPHAWNEVYLAEADEWVPLDATWASSGKNWFNPDNFDETHIEQM